MLRILSTVLVLAIFSCSAVAKDACNRAQDSLKIIASTLMDVRLKQFAGNVANISGFGGSKMPLLCNGYIPWAGSSAAMFPLERPIAGKMNILLLPYEMRSYSDEENMGIIAHEFAHLEESGPGLPREESADLKAVEWVGKSKVLASLIAARDKIVPLLKKTWRVEATAGLKARIEAIRALPD